MIESRTTHSFRTAFAALPQEIQDQARRSYRLFRADPRHPSVRFKKLEQLENVYSVRIGLGYRALGVLEGGVVTRFVAKIEQPYVQGAQAGRTALESTASSQRKEAKNGTAR